MLVTRKLLELAFPPHQSSEARLNTINRARKIYGLDEVIYPEIFQDNITFSILTEPCKINDDAESPSYIECDVLKTMTHNPFTRAKLNLSEYPIDKHLANRISAFLQIEEIRVALHRIEQECFNEVLPLLETISDRQLDALLAMDTASFLRAYDYSEQNTAANPFRSQLSSQLMTLPVIIDDKHIIDFKELTALQIRQTEPNHEALREKRNAATIQQITADLHAAIEKNNDKMRKFCEAQIDTINRNMFTDTLADNEMEYLNPFTNKPITSITINYDLLKKLDAFLTRLPINCLLASVMGVIKSNNRFMRTIKAEYADKSFTQILQETQYPEDKIPESLMTGFIPCSNQTMLCTHPLLLDNVCLIDYDVLIRFWHQSPNNLGLNPLTGKPAETIIYDEKLKAATDNFILNPDYFRESITDTQIRKSDFLRQEKTGNFGVTINSMFSGRRNRRQDQPVSLDCHALQKTQGSQ